MSITGATGVKSSTWGSPLNVTVPAGVYISCWLNLTTDEKCDPKPKLWQSYDISRMAASMKVAHCGIIPVFYEGAATGSPAAKIPAPERENSVGLAILA